MGALFDAVLAFTALLCLWPLAEIAGFIARPPGRRHSRG